jgi:hypothetical protein
MKRDDEKGLRTTVSIPDSIVPELTKIVKEVQKKLPPELSRKISPAFVITMIVRDWISLYKNGKTTIENLVGTSKRE